LERRAFLAEVGLLVGICLRSIRTIRLCAPSPFENPVRGEKLGRPVSLTPSQIREAVAMIDDGKGASLLGFIRSIARRCIAR
jgi:hypothetical protein